MSNRRLLLLIAPQNSDSCKVRWIKRVVCKSLFQLKLAGGIYVRKIL